MFACPLQKYNKYGYDHEKEVPRRFSCKIVGNLSLSNAHVMKQFFINKGSDKNYMFLYPKSEKV